MIPNFLRAAATSIVIFAASASFASAEVSMEEKITLQASMQQHIDRMSVDGFIPHVNLDDGSIANLVATKAHPMILKMSDTFVLCTDFRDPEGKFVNVDFYMAKQGDQFVVFQTEINNRSPLEKLMKDGKVSMLN